MSMDTFLWHDYETWGIHPGKDRPAQFAAIRTDADLKPVGDPIMIYCKPHRDMLPQPEACLVTGISPQLAEHQGLVEPEFIQTIHQEMMKNKTCVVGYNNLRFDDEFTRYTLYRNFYDAYEREYKNGNSRWDLIDVVRLCAAVRPEGINWPKNEEGLPSFRLEELTAANHIEQTGAHDALVDVRATIGLARLLKEKQPKLFEYALSMRDKQNVAQTIGLGSLKPVLHISGMFGSVNHCASVVLPLCMHPTNKNEVLCFDIRESPEEFLSLSVDQIRERLFTSVAELGDKKRIPLKSIHINKCPMVAPVKMLTDEVADRINLDKKLLRKHYDQLLENQTSWLKAREVFEGRIFEEQTDPDVMLYSGGFFSNADKKTMTVIRQSSPYELARHNFVFEDDRLQEMLFRFRARNYPETLNEQEQMQWQDYAFQRLTNPDFGATVTMELYQEKLESLFMEYQDDDKKSALLDELMSWGDFLLG